MIIEQINQTTFLVKCDLCCNEFKRYKSQLKQFHFCSKTCQANSQKHGQVCFKSPPNKLSLDEFKQFIEIKFNGQVTVDDSSYVNTGALCRLIDKDFGEWWVKPNNIRNANDKNGCHPLRAAENRKTTFLKRYGVDNPFKSSLIQDKVSRSCNQSILINHWKTQEQLICTASYEIAFVNWCNKNKIDFDWQIWHTMPNSKKYRIDAFIKTGEFANTWIEIKGWFKDDEARAKWEWFHQTFPNSQLWMKQDLKRIGIL